MTTAVADFDLISGVDLPGELADATVWEEVSAPVCGLCWQPGDETGTGLCPRCLARLPRVGGCGQALALVAALTGGEQDAPLAHLTRCLDCRTFFGTLAAVERVADMEAQETPHAVGLAITAA